LLSDGRILFIVSIPVRGKGIKTSIHGVYTPMDIVSIPVRGKGIKTLPFQKPYLERVRDSHFSGGYILPVNKRKLLTIEDY